MKNKVVKGVTGKYMLGENDRMWKETDDCAADEWIHFRESHQLCERIYFEYDVWRKKKEEVV